MSDEKPRFEAGQIFTETCLAVDLNGELWWIMMDGELAIEKAVVAPSEEEK